MQSIKNGLLKVIQKTQIITLLWFIVPLFAALLKTKGVVNNYLIYKGVYYHTLQKTNLYDFYPAEYVDKNHYGVVFGILIAPFTFLPNWLAVLGYQAIQLFALHYVIRKLPISEFKQNALLLFLLFEAIPNAQNVQINTFIAFVMVGAYVWIYNKKEFQAAFVTMLGFFIKLYGIVGLGLFFFVKRKPWYIASLVISTLILFFLPLLITDLSFIKQSYVDWYVELKSKNGTNSDLENVHQNLSALGLIMRLTQNNTFNLLYIIIPAFILQVVPMVRNTLYQNKVFQMRYLASLLLFIILFNTATEGSTYIVGATGIGLWWLNHKEYKSDNMFYFMFFVFFLGTLSTTDLVPKSFNYEVIRKYGLKIIPHLIVWCICIYQLLFDDYENTVKEYA